MDQMLPYLPIFNPRKMNFSNRFCVPEHHKNGDLSKLNYVNIFQVLPHKLLNPTENLSRSGMYTITINGTVFR